MSLMETLTEQMKTALKAGQKQRLSTVRMLLAELKNEQLKDKPEDEVVVLKRYAKSLARAREDFARAGDAGRIAQADAELAIVAEFLPTTLSDARLGEAIDTILADNRISAANQLGQAMGLLNKMYPGQIDNARAQQILKARLTGR